VSRQPTSIPKDAEGQYDKEAVKALFMSSSYLDWTRFAEDQGWEPLHTRALFPVRTWTKEKRDFLAEKQMDILSGLIHERKFKWTHEIINTLDNYPRAIDMALKIAEAKMSQIADMFKDYQAFIKDDERKFYKNKRRYHPFEKLSMIEVGSLLKGMREITEAKLKALMLDKWAVSKLDISNTELEGTTEEGVAAHRITIEGKEELTFKDMQDWFDKFADKPAALPEMEGESIKTVSPEVDSTNGGS